MIDHNYPVIEFPLRGDWEAIKTPRHDRYAYDFVAVGGEQDRTLSKSFWFHLVGKVSVEDSYSWSQPIYSPCEGIVVRVSDGWPDRKNLSLIKDILKILVSRPKIEGGDIRPFAGNYIIIKCDSAFAFLAHMRQGSLRVSVGQRVERGQKIGEVGNSGFTLAPHLHLQMMDENTSLDNLWKAKIIPFRIHRYERWTGNSWDLVLNGTPEKSERIRVTV